MPQKQKSHQSKINEAAKLLADIDHKTMKDVKSRIGEAWRDNLFEILMTRLDHITPHKKAYAAIPQLLKREPHEIPSFIKTFFKTIKNILKLGKAPATPAHVAFFALLYASVVDTYLKEDSKDHAKTMAKIDHHLGLFEEYLGCAKPKAANE